MRFLSVCSGIEAASVAWLPLGWECAGVSEIEPFPCAVLAHHYPDVKNFGDFTKIEASDIGTVDLLVGGTPCQDFSVAGLRAGIAGDRGRLTIEYCKLAERLRPRWLVWENVPGVLSADDGNAFGIFLGALAELGYGTAYRVLDAQHFGVPQRRRRVFVVGYFGDWRRAAAVLFERESLSGHPAPRRETRQRIAQGIEIGPSGGSVTETAPTLDARCKDGFIRNQLGTGVFYPNGIASCSDGFGPLRAEGGEGEGGSCEPAIAFGWNKSATQTMRVSSDATDALQASSTSNPAIAFQCQGSNVGEMGTLRGSDGLTSGVPFTVSPSLTAYNMDSRSPQSEEQQRIVASIHAASSAVRRLTPIECERLQGFPDDYTLVPYRNKPAADGPRYRALGNSMAVPVMRWIGERIAPVEQILKEQEDAA